MKQLFYSKKYSFTCTYITGLATLLACVGVLLNTLARFQQSMALKLAMAKDYYHPIPMHISDDRVVIVHFYVVVLLALLIFFLALKVQRLRVKDPRQVVVLPSCLVGLVISQIVLLSIWTVKWSLHPVILMGQLLIGVMITAFLWWLTVTRAKRVLLTEWVSSPPRYPGLFIIRFWLWLGLWIVSAQIILGEWTSVNYAALVCKDFPTCHGSWFPTMDFIKAFNFFNPIGTYYSNSGLDMAARTAIQMTHRLGALLTAVYLSGLAFYLLFSSRAYGCRHFGGLLLVLLVVQISLGVLNVRLLLPRIVALSHSGCALLLLLMMVTLIAHSREKIRD